MSRPHVGGAAAVSLHSYLRHCTSAMHEALERQLAIESGSWTRERYVAFLRATLSVVAPIELPIQRLLLPYFGTGEPLAGAVDSLRHDLESMGAATFAEADVPLPAIATEPHAFGAAYVVEGSRLGGQIIARVLARQLALAPHQMTYLRSNARPVGARWRTFLGELDDFGRASKRTEWLVAAKTAAALFVCFQDAFEATGVFALPHRRHSKIEDGVEPSVDADER